MNELEERLAASLKSRAQESGAFSGMARISYTTATKMRTRRRVLAGCAGLAAAAVALPAGLKALPDKDQELTTVRRVTPPARNAKPMKVTVDFGKLKRGADPKVPWYAAGAIHHRSAKTPVGLKSGERLAFVPLDGGGYLIAIVSDRSEPRFHIIRADGSTVRSLTFSGVAVSPDRKRLALVRPVKNGSVIVLANAQGTELRRISYSISGDILAGFAGSRVVISAADQKSLALWDPTTHKVVPLENSVGASTTDGADIVAGIDPMSGGRQGLGVYSLSAGKLLWRSGAYDGPMGLIFSPDRNLGATTAGHEVGPSVKDPIRVVVVNAADGRLRLDIGYVEGRYRGMGGNIRPIFEPDGNILLKIAGRAKMALVRCSTTDGRCELASDVLPVKSGQETPPYLPVL